MCSLRFAAKVNACETAARGGAKRNVQAGAPDADAVRRVDQSLFFFLCLLSLTGCMRMLEPPCPPNRSLGATCLCIDVGQCGFMPFQFMHALAVTPLCHLLHACGHGAAALGKRKAATDKYKAVPSLHLLCCPASMLNHKHRRFL